MYREHADLRLLVLPMGAGSALGAAAGAWLLPWAPQHVLKPLLGAILIASASRMPRAPPR